MNVEIGAVAGLFPEKEYIKGIFLALWDTRHSGDPEYHLGSLGPRHTEGSQMLWQHKGLTS